MTSEDIIVVAFDGLDKELIDEFQLENIIQEEFGSIDNQTGMKHTYTSELFASFITGTNWKEHGVTKLRKWTNPSVGEFEKKISKLPLSEKTSGLRNAVIESINSLDAKKRKYRKEDLETETIFEKIENSRPIYVPSYNPSPFWIVGADNDPLSFGYSPEETIEHYYTREFRHRKEKLFSELENEIIGPRPFLMCHFHYPDTYQHMCGDKSIGAYNEEKLRKMYNEIDELAGQIKEKALNTGYDRIIFMSDHGLPDENSHNKNAFYSANKELFLDKTPKIMDFHDKILELTNE